MCKNFVRKTLLLVLLDLFQVKGFDVEGGSEGWFVRLSLLHHMMLYREDSHPWSQANSVSKSCHLVCGAAVRQGGRHVRL